MSIREWEEKNNKKTVSFLRKLITSILKGRFQVTNFGWWTSGLKGRYYMSISWNNLDETDETR